MAIDYCLFVVALILTAPRLCSNSRTNGFWLNNWPHGNICSVFSWMKRMSSILEIESLQKKFVHWIVVFNRWIVVWFEIFSLFFLSTCRHGKGNLKTRRKISNLNLIPSFCALLFEKIIFLAKLTKTSTTK